MADRAVTSVTDIEEAIEAYLVSRITEIRKSAIQKDGRFIFNNPSLVVAVYEGTYTPSGQRGCKVVCPIKILVTYANARGEEARRKGINPLVMGIVQSLLNQKLGLAITQIVPKTFGDVSTDDDYKENKIVYAIELETSFTIQQLDDEAEAADLLTIGLNYILTPGDDVADASDTVTLTA